MVLFPEVVEKSAIKYQVEQLLMNQLKNNTSLKCLEEVTNIVNQSPRNGLQLPSSSYLLRKTVESAFRFEYHVECSICHTYTSISSSRKNTKSVQCNNCSGNVNRSSENYFIYIPLEQQLR